MNLFKSVPKNKSSVFNGLQAKMTGSNPVALTTFLSLKSGVQNHVQKIIVLKILSSLNYLKFIIVFLLFHPNETG
jgi:hypothetical protein